MKSEVASRASRWKKMVLTSLIAGPLMVPLGIAYLQHRLQARPLDAPRPWDDPVIAQKLSAGRLAKAQAIRDEWQNWALNHKTALQAMLASGGKNFTTARDVYKFSPPVKFGDWQPDTRSGPVKFGWFSDAEKQMANGSQIKWADAKSAALFEQGRGSGERKLQKEYGEHSDFTVAVSDNAGPQETYLWASGRITETTWIKNPDQRTGQPLFVQQSTELVPPYDFLTSSQSD